ncbi:MAG: CcmD family protein [Armatimonadota bacterium]|nr:CcmD family protein [Armatimonadota bacterium]MDR7451448.1 CcmD family protein [Armatimonadota bacterium]MDR7466402.1 CcmD family protein [Armatimonadota bacterium]MDR7493124.1 CcmD family protein [Armatimonadota bacterium]MDR7498119.1 CcmD family protein [Armatimonadota bacterium]
MNPLTAMFIGFAVVWVGLFLYVLRLHRLGREIERKLRTESRP